MSKHSGNSSTQPTNTGAQKGAKTSVQRGSKEPVTGRFRAKTSKGALVTQGYSWREISESKK